MQLELPIAGEPPRSAAALLDRLRALGLRNVDRCTLTRNRAVMVSFAGRALRLHEGYRQASPDVLRAIVAFVNGRTRAERRAAQRVIVEAPVVARVAPPAPERTHPDDEALVARLRVLHGELNGERFGGTLRPVTVRVSRRMKSRLGHYAPAGTHGAAEIVISRRHIRRDGWNDARDTLLHEMVHQWQDETGVRVDHGRTFRCKAREVGTPPTARRIADRPASGWGRRPGG